MAVEAEEYAPDLPEPIIHLIQSFLNHREATRTTLLSMSWRAAWSTRPTIDLAETDFPTGLKLFAKKTFRRYEESNLTIDTFRLCLRNKEYGRFGFASKWTLKALKLGATDLTLLFQDKHMAVPVDAVFASESVVRLYLGSLTIRQLRVVKCSGLKSLVLKDSSISRDSFFNMLSCCPLIENLSLSFIDCKCDDDVEDQQGPPAIMLHQLRSLVLCHVELSFRIKTLFLDDLSIFQNLKHLTLCLSLFRGQGEMIQNISSDSLETLNLMHADGYPHAEFAFHVPSIRKVTIEGAYIPNLSFRSKSQHQWESHVSLSHYMGELSTKWFCELCKFLAKLRRSKIHLFLNVHSFYVLGGYKAEEIKGLKVREVETVTMTMDTAVGLRPPIHVLLDGLFRICRPNMVVVSPRNSDLHQFLEQGMAVKSSLIRSQSLYALRNLEEVSVQELIGEVWSSQPMDTILFDYSTSQQRRFRYQLKWKHTVVA